MHSLNAFHATGSTGALSSSDPGRAALSIRCVRGIVVLVLPLVALTGCGRGNGLPSDLAAHLAQHGIHNRMEAASAPLSSRAGWVRFKQDPAIEDRIVSEFGLREIAPDDRLFSLAASRAGVKPRAVWGLAGRPAALKLKNGAQFEYLFLVTSGEGLTYLLAEYAYG